jgi:4'-phosphopantetheinyl transferase
VIILKSLIPPIPCSSLWSSLSQEEREKASQFLLEKDRLRYIYCRGTLREILASLSGASAEEINIGKNAWGKPFLIQPQSSARWTFNLSHSENCVCFAFSLNQEVGIDIELKREIPSCITIAEQFFSEQEKETLRVLPLENQSISFLKIWTKKEALLKALGIGIGEGHAFLKEIESLEPITTVFLRGKYWCVEPLSLYSSEYIGAIAYEKNIRSLAI